MHQSNYTLNVIFVVYTFKDMKICFLIVWVLFFVTKDFVYIIFE